MSVPIIDNGKFIQARVKLERAKRHIQDIDALFRSFVNSDFCKLRIEPDVDPSYHRVHIDTPIGLPFHIPCGIGDAAHNIRTAFDYVTSYVVGMGDRVSFPIAKTRDDLKQSGRAWDKLKKGTHAALADLILEEIQPYRGGRFKLWEITQLDNSDKHALLVPVLSIQALHGISLVSEKTGAFVKDCTVVTEGGKFFAPFALPPPIKITNQGKASATILFAEGSVFQGQPVIQTLIDCLQCSSKALEALELFCLGTVANPDALKGVT